MSDWEPKCLAIALTEFTTKCDEEPTSYVERGFSLEKNSPPNLLSVYISKRTFLLPHGTIFQIKQCIVRNIPVGQRISFRRLLS